MSPGESFTVPDLRGFPRSRGDEPAQFERVCLSRLFSPLTRG